jgi:mannose-1-phosphate guanylyltransferase
MTNNTNNFCVILAGGKGRRLWPCSREQFPKQFIDFFGTGRTQLQQTYDRFVKIVPQENIFVVTNVDYVDTVTQQLPQLVKDNLQAEPIHRNTAPSAAWATHRIMRLNSSANVAIVPSDQTVLNEEAFARNINDAFDFVATHDYLLAMGVKPTRPEPGYGYIQMGDSVGSDISRVKSFTEKPEREFAQMFMDSGEFLWNTGLFITNARHGMESFSQILPTVLRDFDKMCPNFSVDAENAFIHENFPSYPNLSIDFGLLEKVDDVCVMNCDFGWADLGTWHSMYEAMSKGEGDNVIVDSDVMLDNAHNNVIKLPKDRLAVISGLDGYIVAEKDNVLLICRKEDSSACVRKLINDVQIKKGDDFV